MEIFQQLYLQHQLTDYAIHCMDGAVIRCHRNVLAVFSPQMLDSFLAAPNADRMMPLYNGPAVEDVIGALYGLPINPIPESLRFAEDYGFVTVAAAYRAILPNEAAAPVVNGNGNHQAD